MNSLVHPKEKLYFALCVIVSILIYLVLIISIVGISYLVIGAILGLVAHGILVGSIRGNNVRVNSKQFPEVYSIATDLAAKMGMLNVPDMYVVNSGGFLNAFATRFLGRNFIVLYSEVLEMAYEQGEDALAFVICHEMAHIKQKHLTWRWAIYPAILTPFLGKAYSRACEYTCDKYGAFYAPSGAISGLVSLAVGKKLYRSVNVDELKSQLMQETGFWIWLSEIVSSHPFLPKRIAAVSNITVQPYISQSKNLSAGADII